MQQKYEKILSAISETEPEFHRIPLTKLRHPDVPNSSKSKSTLFRSIPRRFDHTSCESWIDLKKSKRFRTTASLNWLDSCLNEIPKANLCWAGHWSFSSGFDDNPHILSYWDGVQLERFLVSHRGLQPLFVSYHTLPLVASGHQSAAHIRAVTRLGCHTEHADQEEIHPQIAPLPSPGLQFVSNSFMLFRF